MNEINDLEKYSIEWGKESNLLERHDIYSYLSKITSSGRVLEFGCGVGNGTQHLSQEREVLSLENNPSLIKTARSLVNDKVMIRQSDFFNLTDEDRAVIMGFKPQVIVGWFLGGCGSDVFKHTKEERDFQNKSKLYREKIEDIIVSPEVCLASVESIHLVSRGLVDLKYTDDEIFKSQKEDYDKHVFEQVGFEVVEVKNIDWPIEDSEFQYGFAHNPNFKGVQAAPMITSILAKRVK